MRGMSIVVVVAVFVAHDHITHFEESFALERLCKIVSDYVLCRTEGNMNFSGLDAVGNKEITNIKMAGATRAGLASVLFQKISALVVLIKNSIVTGVSLTL